MKLSKIEKPYSVNEVAEKILILASEKFSNTNGKIFTMKDLMVSENKIKSIIDLSNKMRKVILEVSYKCGQLATHRGSIINYRDIGYSV